MRFLFPRDAKAENFAFGVSDASFDGTTDHILTIGYNANPTAGGPIDAAEPMWYQTFESNYDGGASNAVEWHMNYYGPGDPATVRPISIDVDRATHLSSCALRGKRIYLAVSDGLTIPVDFDFSGTAATKTASITSVAAATTGLTVFGALGQTANVLETRNTINGAGNVPTFSISHTAGGKGVLKVCDELGNEQITFTADTAGSSTIHNSLLLFTRPSSGGQIRLSGNNNVGSISFEDNSSNSIFQILNAGNTWFLGDDRDFVFRPNNTTQLTIGSAGTVTVANTFAIGAKTVSYGANDSGGSGFKVLRVAN